MAQEYILRSFEKGDFQDAHGNYWCTAAFEGFGEPVKWVVKDPTKPQEGRSYYGEITEQTSKAGKPYWRFYKKQRQDAPQNAAGTAWKDTSDGQRQGMCMNNAAAYINLRNANEDMPAKDWAAMVHEFAKALYELGGLENTPEVEVAGQQRTLVEMFNETRAAREDTVHPVNEDEPINLDDIPFNQDPSRSLKGF